MGKKKPATNTTGTATAPPATGPAVAPAAPAPAPIAHPVPAPKHSYRDLDPLEEGGPIARKGIAFQDHVAAGKCLDMLAGDGPSEVWCDAEDDIVLV